MACGMDFRKPRLGEYTAFELVFMPVFARGFAMFTQQDIGQLRKGLNFITNDVFLFLDTMKTTYNW